MRLVGFSIENYRSITKAYRLRMGQWTVLIGPNNEGKSNILKALATALELVSSAQPATFVRTAAGHSVRRVMRRRVGREYEWSRDFPVRLQETTPDGESTFLLEFELNAEEVQAFRNEIGSQLNGTLPIQVTIGQQGVRFEVKKQGRGAKTLSKKSGSIAKFIAERLDMEYIPAVRTAESARRIVDDMVERALRRVERESEYQDALHRIAELQEPVLAEISTAIRDSLKEFLPEVKSVSVPSLTKRASQLFADRRRSSWTTAPQPSCSTREMAFKALRR
jgi:energy-coupling factor transporter ATP-binding protein EcfA2